MRIAIVTETFLPSTDGVVTRLTRAVSYFRRQGHEVLVIAPDLGVREYMGARVAGIKPVTFPFYKSRPWTLPSRDVKTILQDFRPDIVHAANPISLAASGVRYAVKLGIPLIASFHTNIPKYLAYYNFDIAKPLVWKYLKDMHNQAELNMVTSRAMYDLLTEQEIHNIHILPRGVDVDGLSPDFRSDEIRFELTDGHPERKLLIFVGRLAHEKDIHKLLPLMQKRDDIALAIVGDGPVKDELEKQFSGTHTVFAGLKKGEELARAYASADAFVFPSGSETLGLVILEGMASGLPVLAVKSPPTLEQITDGVDGLLFDDHDLDSLERAIARLDDIEFRETLRKNARAEAEQYSWDHASHAMLEYYEEAIRLFNQRRAGEQFAV